MDSDGIGRRRRLALARTIGAAALVALAFGARALVLHNHQSGHAPSSMAALPGRRELTGNDTSRVRAIVAAYLAQLVNDRPGLPAMTIASISPVYDEAATTPIGGMARILFSTTVDAVTLDLIRSSTGVPESVESEVTNLRALDAIALFDSGTLVNVSIAPLAGDAAAPESATTARPIDPAGHRDPRFGDTD